MLSGWRGLGAFWLAILILLGGGAAVLQALGPPRLAPPRGRAPAVHRQAAVAVPNPLLPLASQVRDAPPTDRPGRDTPGPTADPDPALLEPGPGSPSDLLPRIAEDGRRPMQVYAAGFDHSSRRPRIGIVLAGIGLNQADSMKAIHDLPGPVTLAISSYATNPAPLLAAARLAEHEYLLSIPMEPQGFPHNDPGPRALMTSLSVTDNLDRLRWLMAHLQGYVGVTNASDAMRGERFAGMARQMTPVLAEVAHRGLLYVDARPPADGGQPVEPQVWSADVNLVVDEPVDDIDVKLAQLEQIAHDKGAALGLAGAPTPVAVQHLAAWANGLMDRGLALAPVSALVRPPARVTASGQ
ncbi:MAG TPA: divergent polysaccharide deacetylase family protein [Acetobacteraceae bacterium]|nr:divergent polysaccharide deacetylase family protein [Acetobacteraceae bacterium]